MFVRTLFIAYKSGIKLALSFSNSGRGSFERKNKRKKQSFHTRKLRVANVENGNPLDFDSLRSKVIVSLAHLGEQKFSAEPGGYTLENWMKNFNLLLDDFEERAGGKNLPKEYYTKRLELTASLLKRDEDLPDLERKISDLREEEQSLNRAITLNEAKARADHEASERKEKIRELEKEIGDNKQELDGLRQRLEARRKEKRESRSLFRRFVSGISKPADTVPIETLEIRLNELEAKIQSDKRKISDLNSKIEKSALSGDALDKRSKEELGSKLSEVNSSIEELVGKLSERQQLSEQRKKVTQDLTEEISKISLSPPNAYRN